ncbi:MAG: hypothetical protein AB7E79_06590 [Rhodospirillaceae bacterium]
MSRARQYLLPGLTVGLIAALYIPSVSRSFGDVTSWSVGDLHINYAAGFIRRGLLGEIAFDLRERAGLSTGVLFPVLFVVLTAVQAALLAALAWPLRSRPALFLLAMLAPALILFPAHDYGGYFRKEAFITIGLFGHALLVRGTLNGALKTSSYARFLFIGLMPYLAVSTLIHENQAVFLPAHALLIYMAHGYPQLGPHILRVQAPVLLPATLCFLLALIFRGDAQSAAAICSSWEGRAQTACDAIGSLAWGYDQVWFYVREVVTTPRSLGIYVVTIMLALVPPVVLRRQLPRDGQAPLLLLVAAILPCLPLFLLGWDWGRWIHMISVAVVAIILAGCRRVPEPPRRSAWLGAAAVVAVLAYVSTWRVNSCCLPTSLEGGVMAVLSSW